MDALPGPLSSPQRFQMSSGYNKRVVREDAKVDNSGLFVSRTNQERAQVASVSGPELAQRVKLKNDSLAFSHLGRWKKSKSEAYDFIKWSGNLLDIFAGYVTTHAGYIVGAPIVGLLDSSAEIVEGAGAGAAIAGLLRTDAAKELIDQATESTSFSTRFTSSNSVSINSAHTSVNSAALLGLTFTASKPFLEATLRTYTTLNGIEGRLALTVESFRSDEDMALSIIKKSDFDKLKSIQRLGKSRLLKQLNAHRELVDRELLGSLNDIQQDTEKPALEKSKLYNENFRNWLANSPQIERGAQAFAGYDITTDEYHPRLTYNLKLVGRLIKPIFGRCWKSASNENAISEAVHNNQEASSSSSDQNPAQSREIQTTASSAKPGVRRYKFNEHELVSYTILRRIDGTVDRKLRDLGVSLSDAELGGSLNLSSTDSKDALDKIINTLDPNWRRATLRKSSEVIIDVLRRKARKLTAEPETVPQYSFLNEPVRRVPVAQPEHVVPGYAEPAV